ncbi:MAG: precorrin-3B C(17)-methyltransferase [Rhodospirillaceae bacterium]|nr:precorrin-3B C(17)-methyltransferase [Rhodospirillaceae bacterium]
MTVITIVADTGLTTAKRLAQHFRCPIHGRAKECDVHIDNYKEHLTDLYREEKSIVFVGALGILIRLLAPSIAQNIKGAAVVVIAEDSSSIIPALGGHKGANKLAREIGTLLNIEAAITTASDIHFGIALDSPPQGYHLANLKNYKDFMAKLLSGEEIVVEGNLPWIEDSTLPISSDGTLIIKSGYTILPESPSMLTYYTECLAVGIGCERGVSNEEILTLVQTTLKKNQLAQESIAVIASIDLKMDESAINYLSAALNRPVRYFDAVSLERLTPRLENPSRIVYNEVGCHGVAEAAALAAAGVESQLIVPKTKSAKATCAIATSSNVIDANAIGCPRGKLFIVGIGPGKSDWLTPEAKNYIEKASDLVGYSLYITLLGNLGNTKNKHLFKLGEEKQRALTALDLAASGREVALISSGDPGIYAMASLVFDCLEEFNRTEWRRIEIIVSPGISAFQACAAMAGAPLGHDFCSISLSDLLTPWATIERRLISACKGDFVIALYNPVSQKRRQQFHKAIHLVKKFRSGQTPVAIGQSLGRPLEDLIISELDDIELHPIDMLSIIIIGNSQTRIVNKKIYTPRGYMKKQPKKNTELK